MSAVQPNLPVPNNPNDWLAMTYLIIRTNNPANRRTLFQRHLQSRFRRAARKDRLSPIQERQTTCLFARSCSFARRPGFSFSCHRKLLIPLHRPDEFHSPETNARPILIDCDGPDAFKPELDEHLPAMIAVDLALVLLG